MASQGQEDLGYPPYPFTAFSFAVEIAVGNAPNATALCNGAFSECDGLEVSFDLKTIREGGNNDTQIRLAGPRVYGTLTLKRGMTNNFDLWNWIQASTDDPTLRATANIVLLSSVTAPKRTERARFVLTGCLPQKLKAPALNAKDGTIAVEELQIAYETLTFQPPSGSGGAGFGISAGIGGSL